MATAGHPHWVPFGPHANCTLEVCSVKESILTYFPSKPANTAFAVLFGIALLAHLAQGVVFKTWGFAISVICGCILEIAGYVGRLMLYNNPFSFQGFLMQIICITVAPVFFCSAIYVILSQTINHLDRSISRLSPRVLYWVFIPCDIVSLILQAMGGALSCVAGSNKSELQRGIDISKAGLIFQVITLGLFFFIFADYLNLYRKSPSRPPTTNRLKMVLVFLFLAVFLILLRCIYRIVELQHGYFSNVFHEQWTFVGLESCVMVVAVFCLNLGHPGLIFSQKSIVQKQQKPPSFEKLSNESQRDIHQT